MRIQRLGVIDDAEVEFSAGLNVITGETGAGKTMVVTGLGLLLGARADSSLVRHGATSAVVEGDIEIDAQHPAAERVREAGGDANDGVILARTVSAHGRSRVHVGGRAAPVSVLIEVGERLVAVHGQADQWRLRETDQHRVLLDEYAGEPVVAALTQYEEAYDAWAEARRRLAEVRSSSVERAREAQMLRGALDDIAKVDPQPGEEDDLRGEEGRLAHSDALRLAATTAHGALVGDEQPDAPTPAVDLLSQAVAALAAVSDHDEALAELGVRLSEVVLLAADVSSDLAMYADSVDSDPARLAHVQQRRSALTALLRNYGSSTTEVLDWAARAAQRLDAVDISEDQIVELEEHVAQCGRDVCAAGAA
ncbi:MAG: AAA family ATPase, partial [Ornithinimicrobium sp.]